MTTTPERSNDQARGLLRTRLLIVAGAAVVVGSAVGWQQYSRQAVLAHESRVIAGDFPALRLEQGAMAVDEFGRVAVNGLLREPPLSVGSQRLTPPGRYVEVVIANDGVAAHVRKTELVIGARDASGTWRPESAEAIAERLRPRLAP